MQSLSQVKTGEVRSIKWMFGDPEVLCFMRSRDFTEGSEVLVLNQMKSGTIIRNRTTRLALSAEIAKRITV